MRKITAIRASLEASSTPIEINRARVCLSITLVGEMSGASAGNGDAGGASQEVVPDAMMSTKHNAFVREGHVIVGVRSRWYLPRC